jgi:hypothetical protein
MKKAIYFMLILPLLFSCNNLKEESDSRVMEFASISGSPKLMRKVEVASDAAVPVVESLSNIEKKIIKDGDLSIKVGDISKAKQNIDSAVKKFNAYYENERLNNYDTEITYDLTIRIPSEQFELFIKTLEYETGEITNKSIRTRDVTAEFIDIETRLKNKQLYLARYTELLKKANTVEDILKIEENIRIIQEEIESKQGQLKYLNNQINYSTLNLNIVKTKEFIYKPEPTDSFSERFKSAITSGWSILVSTILFLFKIWPFIIILFLSLFLYFKYYRNRKRK